MPIAKKAVKKVAAPKDYIQTIGRRKRAVARLRLIVKGDGTFVVNEKPIIEYFPYTLWRDVAVEPLVHVNLLEDVGVTVKVAGGGKHAQSEAVRLAVARALLVHNEDWRSVMRKMGWLTRDARIKERKKPGLKRARRAPQWQKR